MNPVGKPATASVYFKNAADETQNSNAQMSQARRKLRSAVTGYPDPLTDVIMTDIQKGRDIEAVNSTNLIGSGIIRDDYA